MLLPLAYKNQAYYWKVSPLLKDITKQLPSINKEDLMVSVKLHSGYILRYKCEPFFVLGLPSLGFGKIKIKRKESFKDYRYSTLYSLNVFITISFKFVKILRFLNFSSRTTSSSKNASNFLY